MCVSTSLFTHALKINIPWSFKPNAKLEKLVFALQSFLAPKAKDSTLVCRAAASLQPLHLLLSGVEKRAAKSLLHLSAFHPLVLLPSLSFHPLWLTSPTYISSAFENKNATISQLEPFCWCPTLIGTPVCSWVLLQNILPACPNSYTLHSSPTVSSCYTSISTFTFCVSVWKTSSLFQSISRSQSLFCVDSSSLLVHCDTLASLFTLFN